MKGIISLAALVSDFIQATDASLQQTNYLQSITNACGDSYARYNRITDLHSTSSILWFSLKSSKS